VDLDDFKDAVLRDVEPDARSDVQAALDRHGRRFQDTLDEVEKDKEDAEERAAETEDRAVELQDRLDACERVLEQLGIDPREAVLLKNHANPAELLCRIVEGRA